MTDNLSQVQAYYLKYAAEKARLRNVKVNGYPATVVFSEYKAPENLVAEFKAQDNSNGHFYYITTYVWKDKVKSYYTGKPISVCTPYLATKEEGNKIYNRLKETKELTI